jgi:hypothetical protein
LATPQQPTQSRSKEITMNSLTRRITLEDIRQRRTRSRTLSVVPRLLAVALAATVALPMVEATQPVAAGKKFKTITKTISSTGQIAIPGGGGTSGPGNPYPATIDVTAFDKFEQATITDVNLTLSNFTHTFPDNVDVMLVQGNRQATVVSDVGGGTDVSNLTLTLDDQAAVPMPDNSVLSSGTFQPTSLGGADAFPAPAPLQNGGVALSVFNGADPAGQWQLFVNDDANTNTGSLDGGWSLQITAKVEDGKAKEKKHDKHKKSGKKVEDASAQEHKHKHSAK